MHPLPDLELLQTFLTVAKHKSFSQAARSLEITQPAVTKKIKRLEAIFNVKLIDRDARPLQVTQAGALLCERAPSLLHDARQLTTDLYTSDTAALPLMRIGMSDTLSEILGAEFVGAMQSFAHVIELKSGISPWLETAFRARHFDLAVDSPPFMDTAQLNMEKLFADPFVIALPKAFEKRELDDILKTENYVGYGRSSKFGAYVTRILGELGVNRPTRFNFDSTQSLLRFVQAGYGWAITSAFCLLQSPTALRDVVILPCPKSAPRDFYLLNRTGEHGEISKAALEKFKTVFTQLSNGPWEKISPQIAHMIREHNRDSQDSRP